MKITDFNWLTVDRSNIIGGSDMSAILGYSKWSGPTDIMQQKLLGNSVEVNDAMFWGTKLEAPVAEVYEELYCDSSQYLFDPVNTPTIVPLAGPSVAHRDYPWLTGSPDRLIMESVEGMKGETIIISGGLEIKCIGFFSKKAWKEGVPIYYQVQAQVYMMIFGMPRWEFFVLHGGQSHFHIVLEENPFMQEEIIEKGQAFYNALQHGRHHTGETDINMAMDKYRELTGESNEEDRGTNAIPMG
tara:strand:+ start:6736 stop:7464 length:729 start_codon:yes stop_codon:yes gene_type:complete